MRSALVLVSLLASAALLALFQAPSPEDRLKLPPYKRLLEGEESKKAAELNKKITELQEADNYAEAIKAAKELLALRQRHQGADHHEAADVKWHLVALEKVAALPPDRRATWRAARKGESDALSLEQKASYGEALALRQRSLQLFLDFLGEEHPFTAASYRGLAMNLHAQGKYAEADSLIRKAVAVNEKTLGAEHPGSATACTDLALNLKELGKYVEAEALMRQALAVRQKVRGPEHPETALSYAYLAANLQARARFAEAGQLARLAVDIQEKVLGAEHVETAIGLNYLANNLHRQAKFAEAGALYRKVVAIREKVYGAEHPETASVYSNLALNLEAQGKHVEAEALVRQAVVIYQKVLGEEHPRVARSCNNLALNLEVQGKHGEAEQLHRNVLAIREKVLNPKHPQTAASYNNLAANLCEQGKYAEAEQLLRKSLAIQAEVFGADHSEASVSYGNLAVVLNAQEKYAEAEQLYRKVLVIQEKEHGAEHPHTAMVYNNLGLNLNAQKRYVEAELFFRKALAIKVKAYGAEHPDTATTFGNLAVNLNAQGNFSEADTYFRKALAINEKVLGAAHPLTAKSYNNVALNLNDQGRYAEAEPLARAAVASLEAARLRGLSSGLDRAVAQEISPRRGWAIALLRTGRTQEACQALEGHLGRGLLDEVTARQTQTLTADEQQERDSLSARLALVERQIASLLSAKGGLDANREQFETLVKERQATGAALAQIAARLQEKEVYSLEAIQARLPADAALLAWQDWWPGPNTVRPGGEHWAFLIKASGEPVAVELTGSGQDGAWIGEDKHLPSRLRAALHRPEASRGLALEKTGPGDAAALAMRLQQQRLTPLESHLKDVKHLIVLPSETMAGIPVEALTDRFTISYAPSGTLFAKLAEKRQADKLRKRPGDRPASSLLVLADPAFLPPEVPLPGTRREGTAIAAMFPESQLLLGADASKVRLRALTDDLGRFDVLHLATHGTASRHVALSSKLVLAAESPSGAPPRNGELTAGDILHHWRDKLNAELVVLSACETGLGLKAGGEGYLGFSQPLFLAGTRSLVVSLWPVSDNATALLMVRFYENWLGKRPGVQPMPKAEALHEAKHWLRSLQEEDARVALSALSKANQAQPSATATAGQSRPYDHPYYWSGFILIGDPH
jgi:CHAT domain-containing protein/tetratricopeptide (TPR) repeat protein